jgi:cytochrome c peroxidase
VKRRPFALAPAWLALLSAGCAVLAAATAGLAPGAVLAATRGEPWSAAERATLASMTLARLPAPPADASNAVEAHPDAIALGRRLFSDTRLSANGQVACATCHDPQRHFQDGRPLGQGVGTGARRTMPIAGAAHSPWLFWDGRKDSLWSQALGPLEDAAEHGATRAQLARLLQTHYRAEYEGLFGPFPSLEGVPAQAGPQGSPAQRAAWQRLPAAQREVVDRVFANLGKAIAAYERTITPGESRFDRYVNAVLKGDAEGQPALTPQEIRGLRLFIGKAQCSTCHNGPLLTDQHFHNTGVPPRDASRPDRGRSATVAAVQGDPFNCLGPHSDAPAAACQELRFIAADDPGLEGAFKTPGLRNVAERSPYMHAGQIPTLEAVVAHYVRSPAAAVGHSELAHGGRGHAERPPIRLTDEEARELVAFLRTLSELPR